MTFDGFEKQRIALGPVTLQVLTGGEGPPLLLLHGYPQTHHAWHAVAPLLAKDFSLVIPDLPGYGQSRGPAPGGNLAAYSKRSMAETMAALMRQLGHERFAVAGHDRGGRVAYRLAFDRPERIAALVAVDIVPTAEVWAAMDAKAALASFHWPFLAAPPPVPERLIGAHPEVFVGHLLDSWGGERPLTAAARSAYIGQFQDPLVVAATCDDYRAGATLDGEHDLAEQAAGRRIAAPLMVLWSQRYLGFTKEEITAIWRRWGDPLKLVGFDCGHFLAEEAPERVAEALRDFCLTHRSE